MSWTIVVIVPDIQFKKMSLFRVSSYYFRLSKLLGLFMFSLLLLSIVVSPKRCADHKADGDYYLRPSILFRPLQSSMSLFASLQIVIVCL